MGGSYDVWQLSESWRIRFAYFETYGPVWSSPEGKKAYRALSLWDRQRISWNVFALLFGPAYFLAKGMWRKGITFLLLACASTAAVLAVGPEAAPVRVVVLAVPVLAMATANYAYYLHVVEDSRSWNPWEGRFGRR